MKKGFLFRATAWIMALIISVSVLGGISTKEAKAASGAYTILFKNGSSSIPQTAYTGQSVTLRKNTFTTSDGSKKFGGWKRTFPNGTTSYYADGATVNALTSTAGETVVLQAVWVARDYKIVYNEGIHPTQSELYTADYYDLLARGRSNGSVTKVVARNTGARTGLKVTLASAPTISGYTFVGWGNDPVNPTVIFKPGTSADVYAKVMGTKYADIVNLYGIWCPNGFYSYKVDANGGYWSQDYSKSGFSVVYIPKTQATQLIKSAYGTTDKEVGLWGCAVDALWNKIDSVFSNKSNDFISSLLKTGFNAAMGKATPGKAVLGIASALLEANLRLNMSNSLVILKRALTSANIKSTDSVAIRIILSNGKISSVEKWNSIVMYSCRLKVSNNPGYWLTADAAYNMIK